MAHHHLTVSDQILEVMQRIPDCRLDDLASHCQNFPLKAVLCEVSRLSRKDQLQLTLVSTGSFTVQLLRANCRSRQVRGPLDKRGNHKKDNTKSQKERNNQKSDRSRKGGSTRVHQPNAGYLTCNETELETLMSKGEST